jgi:hypothetical protein
VTAIGTASVAHQIAMSIPIAAVRQADIESPSGGLESSMAIAMAGPSHKPTFW